MRQLRAGKLAPEVALIPLLLLAAGLRLWRLDVLPPGLFGDEAINGVDVRMVLSGRGLPVFFSANHGREPLFLYLQALSVALLGPTPNALRLVSALVGILTVVLVYFCALTIFSDALEDENAEVSSPNGAVWPALLAAAGLAVSYWALSLSRLGLRAVLLPAAGALAITLFWRAWQGRRCRSYIWAGLALGLSIYTYTAARLLPLIPLAFIGLDALIALNKVARGHAPPGAEWASWRPKVVGLALYAVVTTIILVPLGLAVLRDPAILSGRSDEVSIFNQISLPGEPNPVAAGPVLRLAQNAVVVARDFYDRGDLNARHNLPARPVNDPLLAVLFTAGLLAALWQIRLPEYRLILIWLVVALAPTLLSTEAPHSLRAAGALVPLCLLYAGGLRMLAGRTANLALKRYLIPATILAVVCISGSLTARDYFVRWPLVRKLAAVFQVDNQLAAGAVSALLGNDADKPGPAVLIPFQLYAHPQVVFALGLPVQAPLPAALAGSARTTAVRFVAARKFDRQEPWFLVWRDAGLLHEAAIDPLIKEDADALARTMDEEATVRTLRAPLQEPGWPELLTGDLPATARLEPRRISTPLDVAFADGMRLLGYNLTPDWTVEGGGAPAFRLSLFWQAGRQQEHGVIIPDAFLHFVNRGGVWATLNHALPSSYLFPWLNVPRTLEDIQIVPVPKAMSPGKALFEIGLYLPQGHASYDRVEIVDGSGRGVADRVDVGSVMVGQDPPKADLTGLWPVKARFLDRIELAGYRIRPGAVTPGAVQVELGWRSLALSATDYTAFVHLVDANGQIVAQHDQPPGGGDNGTTRWVPGETVRTQITLQLPPGSTPLSGLHLRMGLYEPVSGKQVQVTLPTPTTGIEGHDTYLILPVEQ